MTSLASPLNLKAWIDDHRHLLKPPVGNKTVWEDRDFIVMVCGGPNQRKDFHINPTEELFFQVEGDIVLRIVDGVGQQRDIPIREGELFLLPPHVPHSPQRSAGTVGLVVERRRPRGEDDMLRFYCEKCNEVVYEEQFELSDIAGQLKRMMEEFWSDATLRTCVHCGQVVHPPAGTVNPPPKDMSFPRELSAAHSRSRAAAPGKNAAGRGSGPKANVRPARPTPKKVAIKR
ncbi:MAG TPA: 3-hydroxyanthranilate 3,4-dioxygenase [Phycisphaerales bacterium]|nr:3-hydroxyanthranilate 3,4-dioxygenase [Phycisphaerales bacterium]